MSVDFRGLVPSSDSPLALLFVQLMKKVNQNIVKQQTDTIDSDNEDIFSAGQDMDSSIKFHSELSAANKFSFTKDYYAPFEPDGRIVKCWIRGTGLGNALQDISGFNNNAQIHGDPTLVDGSIDLGYTTGTPKSIALRLNRPSSAFTNAEWLQIPDTASMRINTLTTGFSEFSRLRIFSLADQNNRSPTVYQKIDDNTPNDARMLQIKSDGSIIYIVKDGGSTVAKQTATGTVSANSFTGNPYDIFTTYAVSGGVIHIYLDGVDKTLTNFTGSVNWQDTLTNHDWFGFRRGEGSDGGYLYGDFYDYKPYMERVLTSTEVSRHFTNKWSISNIPFGQVELTDYYATKFTGTIGGTSFTSTSFTGTSFHI